MSEPRRPYPIPVLAASALALVLAVAPAAAVGRDAAMGSDGELYFVRQSTYGELFPGQGLADPAYVVLALDVTRPDRASRRLLVPGTETGDVEESASILFEDQSGTLFLLWQSEINTLHWRLNLVGFRGGEWTEPIEISGNPFVWKSSPQLAVTRDTYLTEEEDGSLRSWNRTVVHLLWWEEGASGEPVAQYSPVTLIDGVYTGWNPVYRLPDLARVGGDTPSPSPLNYSLARAPRLEAGRNRQSVVLAFVDGASGELVTLGVELMPGEIAFIADRVRAQISDLGRKPGAGGGPSSLAEKARAQISDLGSKLGLHPGFTRYLAEETHQAIITGDPAEPIGRLADRIRAQISDLGARITDRGFDRLARKDALQVLEVPDIPASTRPPTLIRLVLASVRQAPATGTEGLTMHLSPDGRDAVVAWSEDGAVVYRESRGDGWSGARSLRLVNGLDRAGAQAILERRADERGGE